MDINYLLESSSKFLIFVVYLLNCGDSLATLFPLILYIIGCSLSCYIIYSYYSWYTSRPQEHNKTLLLEIILYGGLFWMAVVFFAKSAALMMNNQDAEVKPKYREFKIVRMTVVFCSLFAVLPNIVALYLYIRYRQHLRLVVQFSDLIRSIEDNRTEFGHSNQIQEVPLVGRRTQSNFNKIHLRSCPNLSKEL